MANQHHRPDWAEKSPALREYHDHEWGVEQHDDQKLFEILSLETYQTGLSWETVLMKRDAFRKAFDNYDIDQVAKISDGAINDMMENSAIIRNKRKLDSTVNNAKVVQKIQSSGQTFNHYLWSFVDGKPQKIVRDADGGRVVENELSQQMAKQMKKDGFKFVGPVTLFTYMFAIGMLVD